MKSWPISSHHDFTRIILRFWKLPTYPSPRPTLTLTSQLGQNVGLGALNAWIRKSKVPQGILTGFFFIVIICSNGDCFIRPVHYKTNL